MSDVLKNNQYIVLKIKDLSKYLTNEERQILLSLVVKVKNAQLDEDPLPAK